MEMWKGEYTINGYTNIVKTEKLADNLFLEFGQRKNEDYQYISLMQGNYKDPKKAKQLYFTHNIRGEWWVYDDSAINFVKKVGSKEEAIKLLKKLSKTIEI